jgi:DNA-binding winged helix-turn-helix (wHTH) protein
MSADASETKRKEIDERPSAAVPAFPMRYLRFGEFQIDLQREEIWRDGERVKAQGKVYQTLLILLSRAGNVVTREEVRKHLWPEDLQVNFDANVNTAMNKLRQVLGDSPDEPTYIETIPRRGYCFVAALEHADTLTPASSRPAAAAAQTSKRSMAWQHDKQHPQLPYTMPMGLRIATLILAGMVVGSILVLAWVSYSRSHKLLNTSRATAFEQMSLPDCSSALQS